MNWLTDVAFTFRLLRKKIGFTFLCVFVIAAGLAIAVPLLVLTKFTAAADLPISDGERFAIIMEDTQVSSTVPTSQRLDPYIYQRLTESLVSFEEFGAFRISTATISDGETAETFSAASITANILALGDTVPAMGRSLVAEDNEQGALPVAVISHRLWQSYYNEAENIVGRITRINGQTRTIVGVMPEGFAYPYLNDIWLPLQLSVNPRPGDNKSLYLVGLINESDSLESADAEVKSILNNVAQEFPEFYGDKTGIVLHYTKIFNSGVIPITGVLLIGLCASVLLLVAFNVGNLLIIRSNERLSEMAVRSAVGGSQLRVMGQVLLESLCFSTIAVAIGLALGQSSLTYLSIAYPDYFAGFPFWFGTSLEFSDMAIVVLCAACIWILSAFHPTWKASKSNISEVLNRESPANRGTSFFTRFLVVMELIASCFLLILSLAMAISIYSAYRADLGINTLEKLSAQIDLSSENYESAESKLTYLDNLALEISVSDKFNQSSFSTAPPGVGAANISYSLPEQDLQVEGQYPDINHVWVSEGYFQQLGIEPIEGRFIQRSDTSNNLPVVIVDELFAQQFWPNESAVGKQVIYNAAEQAEVLTVIGVTRFLLQGNPIGTPLSESTFYRPIAQLPLASSAAQAVANRVFVVASAPGLGTDPRLPLNNFELAIKQSSNTVDRDVALLRVMPLVEMTALSGAPFNLFADLMIWVSVVTAMLAIAGIYGVVSRSVLLRSKELSVRRAVGSSDIKIFELFFKQAGRYLATSFIVGGIGAILTLSLVAQQLNSSGLLDVVFPVASLVFASLLLLVFIASYLPVSRLLAMEPGEALHYE